MMAEFSERLNPLGVSSTEASVILMIQANAGVTQSELGRSLGIKRANIAPMIARLDDRGYVGRTPVDGRSHGLALTMSGAELADRLKIVVQEHERELISRIPNQAQPYFLPALQALWD
jgi:DNA-binding MarR family transcriptional regulator